MEQSRTPTHDLVETIMKRRNGVQSVKLSKGF